MEEKKIELLEKIQKLLDEVQDLEVEVSLFESDNEIERTTASLALDFAWDEILNARNNLENYTK